MDWSARRSLGAFAFVLMLLRVIAPELGHQCAMDVAPVSSAASQTTSGASASHAGHGASGANGGHAAHASHGEHATAAPSSLHPAPESAPDETSDNGCDCAEWCCCLPTVADAPRPQIVIAAVSTKQTRAPVSVRSVAPRAPTARLLPFATAPPAV